jgi:plastocyanin
MRGLAAVFLLGALLAVGATMPHATPPTEGDAPPASPAAFGSPRAAAGPLYTQIPVNEARNVVGRLVLQLTDRGFIPSRFECAINQDITVTLVNTGTRWHNFSIDELDVDVDVALGETTTLTIRPLRLGYFTYVSDTPADRALGMQGTMTIFI